MATVDVLNIEITTNADSAAHSIKNLTKAINGLNRNLNDEKLANISTQFAKLNQSLENISNNSINKITRLAEALQKIKSSGGSITKITKAADKAVTEAQDTANGSTPTPNGGKATDSEIVKTGNAAKDAEKKITGFKKVMNELKPTLEGVKSKFAALIKPITGFLRALGRVAFYRTVRFILKSIVDAVKEGTQNLALFSKEMEGLDDHNANGVLSRYKSEFLYFKNAIATAVIPVLKMMLPVIENVINRIIDLINVIAQITSALSGSPTYTKAKYFFVDYADSIDNAAGSAKKLNKQLAKFDELNNLTTNSGGGSGSDTQKDVSEMFIPYVGIEDKWKNLTDKIKEKFEDVKAVIDKIVDNIDLIGAALAAWGFSALFIAALSTLMKLSALQTISLIAAVTITIVGIALQVDAIKKMWQEGINIDNFKEEMGGIITTVFGSGLIGGLVSSILLGGTFLGGFTIGALIATALSGLALFVTSMKDIITNGLDYINLTCAEIGGVLGFGGIGWIIGIIFGSASAGPFGVLIGLCVAFIASWAANVINHGDEVKDAFKAIKETWEKLTQCFKDSEGNFVGLGEAIKNGLLSVFTELVEKVGDLLNLFLQLSPFGALLDTFGVDIQGSTALGVRTTNASSTAWVNRQYQDRNSSALGSAANTTNNTNVTIKVEGDPAGILKVTQTESEKQTKRTGKAGLSYGAFSY